MSIIVGIVILNHNTADDVYTAIKAISENTFVSFKICVVDNSTNRDKSVSKAKLSQDVDLIELKENCGYAHDNNVGIKHLVTAYAPSYILVMNPDVTIVNRNTIDNLVSKLESSDVNICGIQPLVWTPRYGDSPRNQINIRSCMSYIDCCISSFHPLKSIFRHRYDDMIFRRQMPYNTDLEFNVPSGCFFITKTDIFKRVGFFDDRTFLYNEEVILGHKMKSLGCRYLLDVNNYVVHEQGVSTGAKTVKVSRFLTKCQKESLIVYMKNYLKCNVLQIMFVSLLIELNYVGRLVKYNIFK